MASPASPATPQLQACGITNTTARKSVVPHDDYKELFVKGHKYRHKEKSHDHKHSHDFPNHKARTLPAVTTAAGSESGLTVLRRDTIPPLVRPSDSFLSFAD